MALLKDYYLLLHYYYTIINALLQQYYMITTFEYPLLRIIKQSLLPDYYQDSNRRFFSARSVADEWAELPQAGAADDTQW